MKSNPKTRLFRQKEIINNFERSRENCDYEQITDTKCKSSHIYKKTELNVQGI